MINNADRSDDEDIKYLALFYYNILLYYLGKIDKNEYDKQLRLLLYSNRLLEKFELIKKIQCVETLKIIYTTEEVKYKQIIYTYYKPKFKSFLKTDLYCMVAYNDKELVAMSFNKHINKEQLLFNVNKLKDRKICICHTGKFDEELREYLTTELVAISFEFCKYNLAEVYFSFTSNKLSVKFSSVDPENHTKINMKYDENNYQSFLPSEFLDNIPFFYGAMNENKLLSLVEKNDVEGVKSFFLNNYVYPINAFMASYRKLLRHSLQKTLRPKEYSQTEAGKSIEIFDTLLNYGGNNFYRFDCKGRVTEFIAVCIYNNMFDSKKPITSVKDMKLPSKHGYIDVFNRKLFDFLQAVKTNASIKILFNISEASRLHSICKLMSFDLVSAFSDLKGEFQTSDVGLRKSDVIKLINVLGNDYCKILYPVTEVTAQESVPSIKKKSM